ncbi:gliding motility-associated C-terminal domain-containing protein [Flavobacterium sp. LHD-80]|uniref:gliding motility-associated C-terminal domain-containing protein n=1 Tax=Flavobacterium sp. LHD-80 TaxID=3071411 RepID=UPI0027E00A38|nr:gliding motility-associated C-terminal domain-containing protein [Flavobacterium sp. LHD-80]MDQ6471707.1 gliding motility-associated C-terminal domain-containing protein [Flavobacterium sp. LHD-80]
MKNNNLYKVEKQTVPVFSVKNIPVSSLSIFVGLLVCQNGHAQFSNEGQVAVKSGTILSVYENYQNKNSGDFTNDGEVYIFKDWNNDGNVRFTVTNDGKTFFMGDTDQNISGEKTANFQNVRFENYASPEPFKLSTSISVNKRSEFITGIVLADENNGKMIFTENGFHSNASDLSFVDGQVQKNGSAAFEYPIGDELYFRPSYHASGTDAGNVYTSQYFFKNSDNIHSHSIKEESIKLIDNVEYWNITEDAGSEKIVLSLSLDSKTTPSEFFNVSSDKEVVIVRWDSASGKWLNEGGVISERAANASPGAGYTQLMTSVVKGYGMFTIAIADKNPPPPDDLVVYNAVSPNGDGLNDTFHIKGIDKYPDNSVEIYNRWGVKVYDAKSYNESDKMFAGYSDGRATINRGEKLPTGTYFYILKYNNGKKVIEKAGYLYINNQ